jgi:membrane associated rhomboid family serine protease
MFPIKDRNQADVFPYVTYILIALNVLVFISMIFMQTSQMETFRRIFALIPAEIVRFEDIYTIITSMFLHGSIGHIVGNMLFLNIFGNNLEDSYGHFKFLLFYLVCGFGATFLHVITNFNSQIPVLGASGAIAGVMGGYLALFPENRIEVLYTWGMWMRRATVPAFTMLFYWFIAQLFYGVGDLAASSGGGVAYLAHIGGFITGFIITKAFEDKLKAKSSVDQDFRSRDFIKRIK